MSRLSQALLLLMIALSTLCALEPVFATTDRSETGSVSAVAVASLDQTDSRQHDPLPPCHVCCGANLPVPVSAGPTLDVRIAARSVETASVAPRLAGLALTPGNPPPRA